jgi:RNA polymerase sigma-70 factor (ECF subfamily)
VAAADISQWYRQYGEAVFRRCLRIVAEEPLAMDLMQETFLRAHKYQQSFRGASPLSWLLTIADRCSLDALRLRVPTPDAAEVSRFLEEEADSSEPVFTSHALIPKLLARADERTRQIVMHRYFDELELEEIAQRLDINERTVRRRLERFLASARRIAERS